MVPRSHDELSCVDPATSPDVAHASLRRFLENVSHDLRGPIAVLKEFTSIILDGLAGEVPDRQREYLQLIAESADELDSLVGNLIDVSRLDAAMLGAFRRPCSMLDILSLVRTTLDTKAARREVHLEICTATHMPALYCDPDQIGRVLTHLVGHALQGSRRGGNLEMRIGAERNDASCVTIEIEDDGPGISALKLQMIEERFQSSDRCACASLADLDLGLTVAMQLVELNLGEMGVSRTASGNTVYSLTLPLAEPLTLVRRFLRYGARLRGGSVRVALCVVQIDEATHASARSEIGSFLQHHLRRNDMVYPIDQRSWMVLLPGSGRDTTAILRRLESAWLESAENRPGRSLPNFSVKTRGCWQIDKQHEELMKELRQLLMEHEPVSA